MFYDSLLEIVHVDAIIRGSYGFFPDTISIVWKILVRVQSKDEVKKMTGANHLDTRLKHLKK